MRYIASVAIETDSISTAQDKLIEAGWEFTEGPDAIDENDEIIDEDEVTE